MASGSDAWMARLIGAPSAEDWSPGLSRTGAVLATVIESVAPTPSSVPSVGVTTTVMESSLSPLPGRDRSSESEVAAVGPVVRTTTGRPTTGR